MRPNSRSQRMIQRLSIVTRHLDLFLDKPFAGFATKTRGVAVVVTVVTVIFVPSGVDDDDVTLAYGRRCILQVFPGDQLPFLFGYIQHHTRSKEIWQRHLIHKRGSGYYVGGRVDMGT